MYASIQCVPVSRQHCLGPMHAGNVLMLQLKNAPNFTEVKVHAPTYKGSGGIEPSEARSQKQDQAAQAYAKVNVLTSSISSECT